MYAAGLFKAEKLCLVVFLNLHRSFISCNAFSFYLPYWSFCRNHFSLHSGLNIHLFYLPQSVIFHVCYLLALYITFLTVPFPFYRLSLVSRMTFLVCCKLSFMHSVSAFNFLIYLATVLLLGVVLFSSANVSILSSSCWSFNLCIFFLSFSIFTC